MSRIEGQSACSGPAGEFRQPLRGEFKWHQVPTSPSAHDEKSDSEGAELVGYTDRLSVEPGEAIRFMMSTTEPRYDVEIVRLLHGDVDPEGPGPKEESIPGAAVKGQYQGRRQRAHAGSYVVVEDDKSLRLESFTLQAWIAPTRPYREGQQALLSRWCSYEQVGYGLFISSDARLTLLLGGDDGVCSLSATASLEKDEWYFVAASHDAATGRAVLYQCALSPWSRRGVEATEACLSTGAKVPVTVAGIPFRIGAAGTCERERFGISDAYDGKIDRPRVFSRPLLESELASLIQRQAFQAMAPDACVAAWDFASDFGSTTIHDDGPRGLHGSVVNMPTRAVTGFNWTGVESDFRLAPYQYGAIHFHADDLEDARWLPDFEWVIPADLISGVYAARATSGGLSDHVPFVVRPAPRSPSAPALVLLPTMTYLAYANERLGDPMQSNCPPGWPTVPEPWDRYLAEHPEFGKSLYDIHDDFSGVCYSSALRPIPNLRPGYRARFLDAPRHLAADLYLIDWLEEKSFRHHVATDLDLHEQGRDLLERYKVLITGSHPEYWTCEILEAVEGWVHAGGRVMYLGGNGLYWVTSVHRERPHIIEVRRGNNGSRPWESEPGELHHSTTGELGGHWRDRGKLPNRLFGVGFAAEGVDGRPVGYKRSPESVDPAVSYVFDGVDEESIGNYGMVMNGAVGDEVDRADIELGTPREAVVLASSEPLGEYYGVTHEDRVSWRGDRSFGEARADMVLLESPGGGAVFSVGSISWCGSLSHNNYENGISRITENVLRRFAELDATSDG